MKEDIHIGLRVRMLVRKHASTAVRRHVIDEVELLKPWRAFSELRGDIGQKIYKVLNDSYVRICHGE